MNGTSRSWRRPRVRTLLALALAATVALSVSSYWRDYRQHAAERARQQMAPPSGARCQLWIDGGQQTASGEAASAEWSSQQAGTRALPAITGRFSQMNDHWVVLDRESPDMGQWWIPRDRVLAIQCTGP